MIDTKKPVIFYDDTSSGIDYPMDNILFENDVICLCKSEEITILFDKHTREVSSKNLDFYYAKNVETVDKRKISKNINILVTTGDPEKISTRDKYDAHFWINCNIVMKNHTNLIKHKVGSTLSKEDIKELFQHN